MKIINFLLVWFSFTIPRIIHNPYNPYVWKVKYSRESHTGYFIMRGKYENKKWVHK